MISLTAGGHYGTAAVESFMLGATDRGGQALEQVFLEVEDELASQSIRIQKIVPIIEPDWLIHSGNVGNTYAYFLELDGNGYAALSSLQ